jgi:hypothetical protein
MDNETTGALAMLSIVLSVISTIIHAINHTRFRSNCFGRKLEASLDISRTENLTP